VQLRLAAVEKLYAIETYAIETYATERVKMSTWTRAR